MSARPWKHWVEDILEGIQDARTYIEGMTLEGFAADKKTIRAAAYELTVIGEAVRHIPAHVRERHPEVPWSRMQAMRNIVVDEYFRVDSSILWHTITDDFPVLRSLLQTVLQDQGE